MNTTLHPLLDALCIGGEYQLPGLPKARLVQIEFTATRVGMLKFRCAYGGLNVSYAALIDTLAEENAKRLAVRGWHCVSSKRLTIARLTPDGMGTLTATLPGYLLRDRLRSKTQRYVERMTVDVDSYVALKKLRNAEYAKQKPTTVTVNIEAMSKDARVLTSKYRSAYSSFTLAAMHEMLKAKPLASGGFVSEPPEAKAASELASRLLKVKTPEDVVKVIGRVCKKYKL